MPIGEQEMIRQNAADEQRIKELEEELQKNKKKIKYKIGKVFGENLQPRKKLIRIPGELRKLKRSSYADPVDLEIPSQDPFVYSKYLKGKIKELTLYNEANCSDILYAIGEEVYHAQQSFPAAVCLPFRLLKLRREHMRMETVEVKIVEEAAVTVKPLLPKKESVQSAGKESKKKVVKKLPPIAGIDKCVLFIATNGAGLGHLTRCLAVAKRIRKISPDTEIIFLTTSLALTIIHREGFTAYCIPARALIKNMTAGQWNALLKDMLSKLLQLYVNSIVVFDGAVPYASITAAMAEEESIPKVWIRRGSEKTSEMVEKRNDAEKNFDFVIMPVEAGQDLPLADEKHFHVEPIICLNPDEMWSRSETRRFLKIPEDKTVVYVQLGAGNINDINSEINKVIVELRKHDNVVIVLGESMIGNELKIIEEDIIVIKDYPNAKYFNGFDFAVSACGYNTFHELIYFGVPAIYLPNMNAAIDDQYARAMIAQNHDAGIVITDIGTPELGQAISRMCDKEENERMRKSCHGIIEKNGAESAAEIILNLFPERKTVLEE